MNAFLRLDHLLCDVPNIQAAFELLHERVGFPVAWPIGRYWPGKQTCDLAIGGLNLELVENDAQKVQQAAIRRIAFEPTDRIQEMFDREGIPYKTFEKWESNPELLRLRKMPTQGGAQLLCVNTLPGDYALEFPFFACKYSMTVKQKLSARALPLADGNAVIGVVLGHPEPGRLKEQLSRLGIQEGAPISVVAHPEKELTSLVMKNGPIELGDWPARFRFAGAS